MQIKQANPIHKQMDFMVHLRKKHRQDLFRKNRPYLTKLGTTDATLDAEDLLQKLLELTNNNEDQISIKSVIYDLKKWSCNDDKLLYLMSTKEFVEVLSQILQTFCIQAPKERDWNLEQNITRVFKILTKGTSLKNHDLKEILDNIVYSKIPQFVENSMMKWINSYIRLFESSRGKIDDSSYIFYTGIICRGFYIFENLLNNDQERFYKLCNEENLHSNIHRLINEFHRNSKDWALTYFDCIFEGYINFCCTNAELISEIPFDIIEITLNSFSLIFRIKNNFRASLNCQQRDDETILWAYETIKCILLNNVEAQYFYVESEDHLKFLSNFTSEMLEKSNSSTKTQFILNVSEIIWSLSKLKYDDRYNDNKIYSLIFKILDEFENGVVVKYIAKALSNFISYSEQVLYDVSDSKTLCNIINQSITQKLPDKIKLKFDSEDYYLNSKNESKNADAKIEVWNLLNNIIEVSNYPQFEPMHEVFFEKARTKECISRFIFDCFEFDKTNILLISKGLTLLENLLTWEDTTIDEDDLEYLDYMRQQQLEEKLDEITFRNTELTETWERIYWNFKINTQDQKDIGDIFKNSTKQNLEF